MNKAIAVITVFLFTLITACGGGGNSNPVPPDDIIIPETTKVLKKSIVNQLESVTDGTQEIMIFRGGLEGVHQGDIIVSGVTDKSPYGFLRRVESMQILNDGSIKVVTSQAALDEAIEKGSFSLTTTLRQEDIQGALALTPGTSIRVLREPMADSELGPKLDINVTLAEDPLTKLEGSISLTVKPTIKGKIEWFTLQSFEYTQSVTFDAKLDLSTEAEIDLTDKKGKFAQIHFTPITVLVGPVPIVFTPKIDFVWKAGLDIESNFSTGLEYKKVWNAGLRYANANWEMVTPDPEGGFDWHEFEADVSAEFSASVGPELDFLLYGVIGPSLKAKLTGEIDCSICDNPWMVAEVGFDIDCSVKVKALSKVMADIEYDIFNVTWPFWERHGTPLCTGSELVVNIISPSSGDFMRGQVLNLHGKAEYGGNPIASQDMVWKDTTTGSIIGTGTTLSVDTASWSLGNHEIELTGTYDFSSVSDSTSITLIENSLAGAAEGKVVDAINGTPLLGALVTAQDKNDGFRDISTVATNNDGIYNISLPSGDYRLEYTLPGYQSTTQDVTVEPMQTVTTNMVLQIDLAHSGEGVVGVHVISALTGEAVPGVAVELIEGINVTSGDVVETCTTDANGHCLFENLYSGHYTAKCNKDGYLDSYGIVTCIGHVSRENEDIVITPELGDGEIRTVLTWGETPSDLDSHTTGPDGSGGKFHMYYIYKDSGSGTPWPGIVNLDLDDVTSYGPETTTLHQLIPDEVYRFTVHDYTNKSSTNSTALSNSGAVVKVFSTSGLIAKFNVPVGEEGTVWTVFELENGAIRMINNMSYESVPGNISSLNVLETDAHLLRDLPDKY